MSIEELELLRKQTISKCKKLALYNSILTVVIIVGYLIIFRSFNPIVLIFVFLTYFPYYSKTEELKKHYKEVFMKNILPIAVQSVLKDAQFFIDSGITEALIESTHSMSTGDRFNSSNLITGKYKDIKVSMSDVYIATKYRDENGNTTYDTLFLGQWMVFDFNKEFKSNVQVWEKGLFGGISKTWNNKLKKIELESVEFNKKFKVLSEDEIEAFYLITPSLMEKITQVEASIKGTLMMVFMNNQLHVAVYNHKTTFNVNINKPIDINRVAEDFIRDLDAIIKFVDILDLDNDLFKNENQGKKKKEKTSERLDQTIIPAMEPAVSKQSKSDLPNDAVAYLTDASDGVIDNK